MKAMLLVTALALSAAMVSASRAHAAEAVPVPEQVVAEPVADGITLAEAIRLAWQRAPASRAATGQRLQSEAENDVASLPWADAPSLEVTHWNDRWQTDIGQQESELGLAWPLLMPGQRAARRANARAGLVQAEAAERLALLQLSREVQESAWMLVALQTELAQAESNEATLTALADDVDRRVRAGDLARADALVARSEALMAGSHRSEIRQRFDAAVAGWNLLTGQGALPVKESVEPVPVEVTDAALANHPRLKLADAERVRARTRATQVRHERRTAPELTLGMRRESPVDTRSAHESLAIGVRLPLATNIRARPLEVAAQTDLELAELAYERLRDQLRVEAESARRAALSCEEQLHAAASRASLLRERAQLVNQSFRAGESPLPELLRALAASADAESLRGRQQAALGLAYARFHYALGNTP